MHREQPYSSPDHFQSFCAGQEQGFDHYFKKWFKPLCFYVGRSLSNEQEIQDIVSDTFVRVWHKRTLFTNEVHLRSYLYIAVQNSCLQLLRRRKVAHKYRHDYLVTAEKEEPCFLQQVQHTEFLQQLYASFERLPPVCRRVLTKIYIEGKTVREVAAEMNIKDSTIATHRQYGLRKLRKYVNVVPKRSFGAL